MWQCPLSSGPQCKIRVQSAQMWSYFYKKVASLISNDKKKGEQIKLFQVLFDFARHFCPPKCQTQVQLPTMQPGMFQIVPPFSQLFLTC